MNDENLLRIRDQLNNVSPSFCLAKWLQVTIHLQNGQTHSCHHPKTHKIHLSELALSNSALHNTSYKKLQRQKMLNSERPKECEYCWKIEDSHHDNISDRTLKSAEDWALPYFNNITTKPWDYNHNPHYVEVSFGHTCNFKCMYCVPSISSSITKEYMEYGHYPELPHHSLDILNQHGLMPIPKDDVNPYVEAFWKWWPDLIKDLKVFRITGGEPLLNPSTFKFLEFIQDNPQPELSFSINSNLGVPDAQLNKLLLLMKNILKDKKVKGFEFYTSVDTFGKCAEYIRYGLNYEKYIENVEKVLTELPETTKIVFMCTYNSLSVVGFRDFLKDIIRLKKKYFIKANNETRVILDLPYLKDPQFMSLAVLTEDFWEIIKGDLEFMKKHSVYNNEPVIPFSDHEIRKMERIYNWCISMEENDERTRLRKMFHTFYKEYDRRRNLNFDETFPEMKNFRNLCERNANA